MSLVLQVFCRFYYGIHTYIRHHTLPKDRNFRSVHSLKYLPIPIFCMYFFYMLKFHSAVFSLYMKNVKFQTIIIIIPQLHLWVFWIRKKVIIGWHFCTVGPMGLSIVDKITLNFSINRRTAVVQLRCMFKRDIVKIWFGLFGLG